MSFQRVTNLIERPAVRESASVRVLHGPDTGTEMRLPAAGVIVGAASTCDVVLHDPSVSARHVSVTPIAQGFDIEDLGSRNGTLLDGIRLDKAIVPMGATLCLGQTVIQLLPAERPGAIPPSEATSFGELVGASAAMRTVYALLERAAEQTSPVLLLGETGTGKELAARALHAAGPRAGGPFVVVDCGAASDTLLAGDLFGHLRGAFTGAHADRVGAFAAADGGTLFLDEIGELPLALQPKLLRLIESGEVTPLGGTRSARHDVRIVAATHRDLWQEVSCGDFRGDLYYRLAVIEVHLPPLRARRDDIPRLAAAFFRSHGVDVAAGTPALLRLQRHDWPGNVRELRNVVARAVTLAPPGTPVDQMPFLIGPAAAPARDTVELDRPWAEVKSEAVDALEREYFTRLFARHGDNLAEAARVANLERKYLYKVMERLGITRRP